MTCATSNSGRIEPCEGTSVIAELTDESCVVVDGNDVVEVRVVLHPTKRVQVNHCTCGFTYLSNSRAGLP